MASTNQSPQYKKAEQMFLISQTDQDRIFWLEEMIKQCPKHKSSEKMLANLKTRYKKLKEKIQKIKKSGKTSQQGIKKQPMQTVIVGFPNTGKSSLFKTLTNQDAKISQTPFTTYQNHLGTMRHEDAKIQIIDTPPFPTSDKNLINSTDTILLTIDNLEQLNQAKKYLENSKAKIITIFNKSDNLNENQKRKISETLKSKKQDFFIFSTKTKQNLKELKNKIFQTFPIIRIYTKEPHKPATNEPLILKQNSTISDVAEKILKGMSKKIKTAKIWGPSSKFQGQIVGLEHKLKDKDTVEFCVR